MLVAVAVAVAVPVGVGVASGVAVSKIFWLRTVLPPCPVTCAPQIEAKIVPTAITPMPPTTIHWLWKRRCQKLCRVGG